jgi:hypothetical protein
MSETKHVAMNAKQREQLDQILRDIAKERKCAIEADLESRLSYRAKDPNNPKAASWDAYSRFLLSDGHTVYVALRTMKASVSKDVDKWAISKVEKRLARQKKASEQKAKAAESKAEPKSATVKVKATTKKMPVVKYDKDLPTLEATGARQVKK